MSRNPAELKIYADDIFRVGRLEKGRSHIIQIRHTRAGRDILSFLGITIILWFDYFLWTATGYYQLLIYVLF